MIINSLDQLRDKVTEGEEFQRLYPDGVWYKCNPAAIPFMDITKWIDKHMIRTKPKDTLPSTMVLLYKCVDTPVVKHLRGTKEQNEKVFCARIGEKSLIWGRLMCDSTGETILKYRVPQGGSK